MSRRVPPEDFDALLADYQRGDLGDIMSPRVFEVLSAAHKKAPDEQAPDELEKRVEELKKMRPEDIESMEKSIDDRLSFASENLEKLKKRDEDLERKKKILQRGVRQNQEFTEQAKSIIKERNY